jgi:hypothetical protein
MRLHELHEAHEAHEAPPLIEIAIGFPIDL